MPLKINGATSGSVTLHAPATGSDVSMTMPTSGIAPIDSPKFTGNVGVGTNSPTSQLTIKQASAVNDAISIEGFNGGGVKVYRNETTGDINIDAIQQGFSNIVFRNTPSGGSITERMRINSSGIVTMPNQPAFAVSTTSGSIAAGSIMPYNTAALNRGSVFNTSTYRFTAPVAGVYLLSVYDIGSTTSTSRFFLFKNGVDLEANHTAHQLRAPNGGNYSSATSFWLVSANANDYFHVTVNEGTSYGTLEYAWFSGFLVG
jgi:hypothetical protein